MGQRKYVTNAKEFFNIMANPKHDIQSLHQVSDKKMLICYKLKQDWIEDAKNTNVVIAGVTTSHARLELYNLIDKLGTNVLYFDTGNQRFILFPTY